MGNRIIVCGEIHLSKHAFESAQDTNLIEFFYEDPEDEVSFHPKGVPAKTLFAPEEKKYRKWARNSYEADTARWIISASLHDDDWHNADPEMLTKGLARLKDADGVDFVVAFAEWNQELDGAWRIDRGQATAYEDRPRLPDQIKRHIQGGEIEKALAGLRQLLAVL